MALLTAERRSSASLTSPRLQCWNCSTRHKEDGVDDDDDDDDGDDGDDS